ncbi:glycosyltransferase family 4 protein [Microbacterium sp. No. 7]|uniref:glycosyltransferase family 4 protein n=1 Tax=Microbacterium sp. No. 7 TaxID=1714373 RepID=UPI0018D1E9C5|nr:glycosyltransferase family 1 protein [Microbacterium sp. No. 7]
MPDALGEAPVVRLGDGSGQRWEQFSLPRVLRSHGKPLLLNLASTGPVIYHNQIVTHHDITYVRFPESFSRGFRISYAVLMPLLLRNNRGVITVSEFSRKEIGAHYRIPVDRIDVVPNGVTASVVHVDADDSGIDEPPYLLAVSSPNKHKNFTALIDAFVAADLPRETQLLIVGQQDTVFSQTHRHRSDRIRWLGRVDDAQLSRLYRNATAFAFPSLYEGFGIPPIEAQRSGTPVIAARAASLPEVLGDSVLWFDPYDTRSMTRAIERVFTDKELRLLLSERGQVNSAQYTWRSSAERVAAIVAQLRSKQSGFQGNGGTTP